MGILKCKRILQITLLIALPAALIGGLCWMSKHAAHRPILPSPARKPAPPKASPMPIHSEPVSSHPFHGSYPWLHLEMPQYVSLTVSNYERLPFAASFLSEVVIPEPASLTLLVLICCCLKRPRRSTYDRSTLPSA